nr:nascent polypeptide-associated complex subunit beta-like [Ipomoea batatas]GMC74511.1 nascent polypeptide-associated complex subunit beta-like [Ipomoea batatas]
MNVEKLQRMAGSVRTGGKGTMRRKKKAVHKTNTTDDKRLQSTLKRIGVNAIPAIEEVNIFKEDIVIQFLNPKVQASIAANTWVVSGSPQTKSMLFLPFSSYNLVWKILVISFHSKIMLMFLSALSAQSF